MAVAAVGVTYLSTAPRAASLLPTVTWAGPSTLSELHHRRQPVRLVGSPTTTLWRTANWTLAHVASHLPPQVRVQHSRTGVFRHYDPSLELAHRYPPDAATQVHPRSAVAALLSTPAEGGYYLHDELRVLAPGLAHDVVAAPFVPAGQAHSAMTKLWLGGAGVMANLHYDATHNVFHQVTGTKRFLLFPPAAYAGLALYSRLHPHHRQSRLDLSQPRAALVAAFPAFATVADTMVDVTLAAGDTMYLPPFWFHCVVTTEPSVSVNVWTDAEDVALLAAALADPVPYLAPLEAAGVVHDLDSHLAHLARFVGLVLARALPAPATVLRQMPVLLPPADVPCGALASTAAADATLEPFATALVAGSFLRMADASARALLAVSYAEALTAQFMAPEAVGTFLRYCVAPAVDAEG
ncbi:hypothetical protein ACHHYP_20053 [Achlya hypogyna]|uniref:JmjC domain-containing protein n=1 Tax=Achlya hypogyna TaxID=1202772 RepID=A0A1V9Z9E0_ACHHY|nr:hypothetical protein ACHHYP_20053 [Achlya hypogyna]